ncbi:phosphatase inhibitor-domain-containing protein [Zychaea mexicana]|uniref:phosphatase inhibitor-domain-containing protein n=1 Tax=Zychaea mexicana TaxID=64656 RepID=UPI0022FE82CB|nr:phosphatase inhibitor-domain-containing protein [Zychaea mexicana]KAI9495989.1 phosphatase inhibitor-domain-containing protein [Zychaea mexicana]
MEEQRTNGNYHPPTQTRMAGGATSTPTHGSRTITLDPTQDQHSDDREDASAENSEDEVGVLRLRGDMSARRPRAIQWDESVVDNEHMNKKKSKICCIYQKPRAVGESSSESESDSDSSSSSSSGNDSDSSHGDKCGHKHHHHRHSNKKKKRRNPREASPNAYERQPVYNKDRQRK